MNAVARIQFQEEGPASGPVLLLLNSLAASAQMWRPQMPLWSKTHRVLRFDYAGHAGTPAPDDAPTTSASMAQALLDALDASGVDRFDVVGLSLGGMIGLQLAALAPRRVRRLVMANGRWFQVPGSETLWNERVAQVKASGAASIADGTVARWFTEPYRIAHPDTMAEFRTMIASTAPDGYAACVAIVRDYDARQFAPLVRCPTLLISGVDDVAAPWQHVDELRDVLGCRHLQLPCAHISNTECEAQFTEAVTAFLAGAA